MVEPVAISITIAANPFPPGTTDELRLETDDGGGRTVAYRHALGLKRANTRVDVGDVDDIDVMIGDQKAVTIPRHFWEGMSRGRLGVTLRFGGVQLVRAVEPTDGRGVCAGRNGERTCWSTERWYFPIVWEATDESVLPLVVKLIPSDSGTDDVRLRLLEDGLGGDVLAETTGAALERGRWQPDISLSPSSTLVLVVGDAYAEIPPDLWNLSWANAKLRVDEDVVWFDTKWASDPRRLSSIHEPIPLVPLESE